MYNRANIESQLAAMLQATGAAHHQAFSATNGEDPDWPAWYAAYLAPRLGDLFKRPFEVAQLQADLRAVDVDHQAAAGMEMWPEYYARWFLRRWGDL